MTAASLWRAVDENLEKFVVSISFAALAGIIVLAVVQRFVFSYQSPWSGSIPVYLFLWVTWIGAAYNIRTRTQLRFGELRANLPYNGKFLCVLLDAALWLAVSAIVIYFAIEQIQLVHMNFAVVQGTDNLPQWWFYLATPLGWGLIVYRVIQNLISDIGTYVRKEPLETDTTIFTAD
ncbi:MAG: TRAP transporter small permease [Rhodospirillales bacterium]